MAIHIGPNDAERLKHLVHEGVRVKQEVEDLSEGLRETVKAVAQELDIKPSTLNKVIRIAYKGDLDVYQDEFGDIEAILGVTGNR